MTPESDNFHQALDAAARAKQGKVTGLIIPPPEIRAVVDKTAQFVARNGKSFEQRILASGEGKTSKFNFMKSHDPYHAYYEYKIRENEEGKIENSVPHPITPGPSSASSEAMVKKVETASAKPSIPTPLARLAQNKPSEPPRSPEFCVQCPPGLSSLDTDAIKLAAQYTALNGRDFLSGLAQREQRNPQFDFLKPTHMLFSYFTSLVDTYSRVLQPSSEQVQRIRLRLSRMNGLSSAVGRWEWNRAEEEKKKKDALDSDAERAAFQAIDWYDFTVVETIEFGEDELFEQMGGLTVNNTRFDTSPTNVTDIMLEQETRAARHLPPPPPPPPKDEDDDDIKVISDYKPRIATKSIKQATMIDPISGRAVPVDSMSEHMRIQLMDPRWRVEQQRFQEKQRETGYAEGSSIADSLKSFARQRGDIFGSSEEEIVRNESAKRPKRNETDEVLNDDHSCAESEQVSYETRQTPSHSQSSTSQVPLSTTQLAPPAAVSNFNQSFACPPSAAYMTNYPPYGAPPYYGHMPAILPPSHPPSNVDSEKRLFNDQKQVSQNIIPEEEFAKKYPEPIEVRIAVPTDASCSNWNLSGQTINIPVGVMTLVKDLKEMIGRALGGMPINKQQLKHSSGFLKDNHTLASYNIGNAAQLELSVRSRGGKK